VWWRNPGKIALSYDELMRRPTAAPAMCPQCECHLFWESMAGGMSCVECERIPSFSVLKDFWKAIPADKPNAEGTWSAIGWERWFPRFAGSISCLSISRLLQNMQSPMSCNHPARFGQFQSQTESCCTPRADNLLWPKV
jgi:hypothetical protein